MMNVEIAAMHTHISDLEKSRGIMGKWRNDFERSMNKEFEKHQKEESRLRGQINAYKANVETKLKESMQFTHVEGEKLRDISNNKWDKYSHKVENLAKEVFEEVVEHEMVLAGLCDEDFESTIPSSVKNKQQNSLLRRMSTLKANLI